MSLYVVSLHAASLCAEFTRTKVEKIVQRKEITVFAQIQLELEETSKLINKINEALGVIPLNLFTLLFLEILLGISMGCMKDEINSVHSLKALGPVLLCHVIATLIVGVKALTSMLVLTKTSIFVQKVTLIKLPQDSLFFGSWKREAVSLNTSIFFLLFKQLLKKEITYIFELHCSYMYKD